MLASWEEYKSLKETSEYQLQWVSLGPVINSARVEAIQGDPSHPGIFYVAFGSGNLWKTSNHGLSWKPIFEDQAALGIGDIALAPSNTDVIYIGTGESLKKPRNFTMPGVGVFRSDDAGESWNYLGLPDSYHIGEIAVHPLDPDIAFVAVMGHFWTPNENRGLYRTKDGGKTWDHVLYIDENTGANDVVIALDKPEVIYASMWNNYPDVAGENSGIFTSKDGGDSWIQCKEGLPDGPFVGRIGLAVSQQDANKIYALMDHRDPKLKQAAEVYRSLDGGENWTRTHDQDLKIMARLGWYFADCYLNPKDDEEFYGLGVRLAHSTDGGSSFSMIGGEIHHHNPSPAIPLHLDHCEMWINPINPDHLALGNDGGLYMSYDKGETWRHFNNIPAGEFYDISVDNQKPYNVYGGVQDDASVFGPSKEWNPIYPDGWKYIWIDAWAGGDGCVTYPDPEDPDIIYTSSQNGGIFRKNMQAQRSKHIRPRLPRSNKGKQQYNFIAPYIISSHNTKTLYHAGNYVFKTEDKGDNWRLISPDLSLSSDPQKKSLAAGAIAESPLQQGLLFMGTDHGAFWVTSDDGESWEEQSDGLPVAYIRSIVASKFKESRIYLTLSGMNYDDLSKHVYTSDDRGVTWKNIGSNLPDETMNCILEDPIHENWIYVGGHRGVYLSMDRGGSWQLLGANMAASCISDLVMQEEYQDLLAGTHGRGIYKMNLKSLYDGFGKGRVNRSRLLPIKDGRAPWYNDTHRDVNPESVKKTTFAFWLEKSERVSLKIKQKLKTVATIEIEGKPGLNEFRWDLVTSQSDNQSPYFIHFKKYLPSGSYTVQLKAGNIVSEQDWLVRSAEFPFN